MGRSLALALLLQGLAVPASAQVIVETSTSTTAEVTVTGRVTTTTTERVVVPDAVVVEPVVVDEVSEGPGLAPLLAVRGELSLSGAHDMPLAGMTAMLALDGGDGWGGGFVGGYFGEIGTNAPSEVHLALEGWRDFGVGEMLGFVLLTRVGTALALESEGPSPRLLTQLGIGARVSIDPRIAVLLDARGELLLRPADLTRGAEVSGGLVITTGLSIRLD